MYLLVAGLPLAFYAPYLWSKLRQTKFSYYKNLIDKRSFIQSNMDQGIKKVRLSEIKKEIRDKTFDI